MAQWCSDRELEAWETALGLGRSKSLFAPAVANPSSSRCTWRWAYVVLMGTVLVPERVTCIAFLFTFFGPMALLFTVGCSVHPAKPAKSWRRKLVQPLLKFLFQVMFFSAGFLVKMKGKKATREEASVLVIAPHSTSVDANACVVEGLPWAVSASQYTQSPVVGKFPLVTAACDPRGPQFQEDYLE